eukprot:TRINITY_DN37711_c0_g1_i1.p1 TRINITY_DN37711_c0_g1~~TRINITY_DN37711_c0_g1_i1.p1  ORF type:complete len:289 (-),score=32.77 TRINITY_DN37711_c0_g1_i1:209-1075(-)
MGASRRARSRAGNTFLESVTARLDRLEFLLADLHWQACGQFRQSWFPADSYDDLCEEPKVYPGKAPVAPSELFQNVPLVGPSGREDECGVVTETYEKERQPSGALNNFAKLLETLKADSFIQELTDLLVHKSTSPNRAGCLKCCAERQAALDTADIDLGECVCDELLCWSCYRDLRACSCQSPRCHSWRCAACGGLDSECVCDEGGQMELRMHFLGTEDQCEHCGTYAAQDDIRPCDGNGCPVPSAMFHEACMRKTGDVFLCEQCVALGNKPFEDESQSNSSDQGSAI